MGTVRLGREYLEHGALTELDLKVDATDFTMGASEDFALRWATGDASNHAAVIGIGDTSQQIHITDAAAMGTDWARSAGTHPELSIHSNTTPATDYLAIGNHDGTMASITLAGGTWVAIKGANLAQKMTITTQVTTAGNATFTAAQFAEGIIDRDPNGGARADVIPTAADLLAGIPDAEVGTSFFVIIDNNGASAEDITVTAGTGGTMAGSVVVADGKAGLFLVTFTNVTASSEAYTMIGLNDTAA